MNGKDPLLYTQTPDDLTQTIQTGLQRAGWREQKESPGGALVQLFGRLAQVIIHRLNQTPRQHFRTFLNEAGIDRLPPRAASAELTFTPAPDGPPFIRVPQRTQVATRPTETQPEIIFETEEEIAVVPAELAHCFVVDPVNYTDCTALATGQQTGAFAAFQGETERTRVLYVGHDTLFSFADDASRQNATLTLAFTFANGDKIAKDQWRVQWLYWNGEQWTALDGAEGAHLEDQTENFCKNGAVVFSKLPKLAPAKVNEVPSVWLAARLTGGNSRANLPVISKLAISRAITILPQTEVPAKVDNAFAAVQAGSTFLPLDAQGPAILPLGPHPVALDAFYLHVDEAFAKNGALVTLTLPLDELSDNLAKNDVAEQPKIAWEYFSEQGWTLLGQSWLGSPELAKRNYDDSTLTPPTLQTNPFTRKKYLEFKLPENANPQMLPKPLEGGTVVTDIYTGVNYVQITVPDNWANSPAADLIHGAYLGQEPAFKFRDKTCGLTTAGLVQFVVPGAQASEEAARIPRFAQSTINGQTGYWVRARLVSGHYNVTQPAPSLWQGLVAKAWLPTQTYPPVIKGLRITYQNYISETPPEPICRCQSLVDTHWRDHAPDLRDGRAFQPLTGTIESPALYLGFLALDRSAAKPALPADQLIRLRIAVAELAATQTATSDAAPIAWAYWNGRQWRPLRRLDGTLGLQRTGYLQFYACADHAASNEFGETAYWLRACPAQPTPAPYLQTLRLNTVAAINAETIQNEIVRPVDDGKGEKYFLARAPVLPESVQLEVFEPDQRSETAVELTATNGTAPAANAVASPSAGTWMPWSQVESFHGAQSDSRVYLLDLNSGEIQFGNGEQGKALPPGLDNVRAKLYRTHRAAAGNVAANTIRALHNATGDLATVRSVTNWDAAAGGADVESETEAEERGPHRLKNRQRAVTIEDFAWLAREVEGVAQAYCLPTHNGQGEVRPGWVTIIITPQPLYTLADTGAKPIPTPALVQQVRAYVKARALMNLDDTVSPVEQTEVEQTEIPAAPDEDQIVVKGPAYLVVAVHATVIVRNPEQGNQVQQAIIQRLDDFLHPTKGGPDRKGWEPGRDVYLSEVAAEIEQTPGVDYVKTVTLESVALQQQCLSVTGPSLPWAMPAGSQVSTFDDRLQLVLAAPLTKGEAPTQLTVYALKAGDEVKVASFAQAFAPVIRTVVQIANGGFTLWFAQPFEFANAKDFAAWKASEPRLTTNDQSLTLPLQPNLISRDKMGKITLFSVAIHLPTPDLAVGATVEKVAADLNARGGVNLAVTGQPGPLPAKPQRVQPGVSGLPLLFDEPLVFADPSQFEDWQKAQPWLTSADQSIRLPLQWGEQPKLAGEISLLSGIGRGFQPGDQVSLTQREQRAHRIEFGRVQTVTVQTQVDPIFVPDDALVCAGSHEIKTILEA